MVGCAQRKYRRLSQCKRLLQVRFREGVQYVEGKYNGLANPTDHIMKCTVTWRQIPKYEWMLMFVHTLDIIPKNSYIELELRHGTT